MADKASPIVGFGGFTPMGFSDVDASTKQFLQMKSMYDHKQAVMRASKDLERARASSPRRFTDDYGTQWTYVVLDEKYISITKVRTTQEKLEIPSVLAGMPVHSLGSDICSENDTIREIVCPDSVERIGACAFRLCRNLKRVAFPHNVANFSSSWVQHCDELEEMVLPGLLEKILPTIFDNGNLKYLHLGPYVNEIAPGAFEKTQLETLEIDEDNPFFTTDGTAIYSHDGLVMVALAKPVNQYAIKEGCTTVSKKACNGILSLEHVHLPESLTTLEPFAFAHTGITQCKMPSSLTSLGEKAFYYCASLTTVELNEGLQSIGDSAFEESALESIHIPATIESIGTSISKSTNIVHSGEHATFSISEDSPHLLYDGEGGLYRREEDGLHFVQLIDREMTAYDVKPTTRFIDPYSFAYHTKIERVTIPEGVVEIGRSAFRVCARLAHVVFPESLETIGREAFLDTVLESITLSSNFKELGPYALISAGAHHMSDPPQLRHIEVSPDNKVFYVESGILCKREKRGDIALVFNDAQAHVVIPDSVVHIDEFAFNNMRNIKSISIGPNLQTIGTAGLTTWSYVADIHLEVAEPIEGRTVFDVNFPDTPRAPHEISLSLGGSSWVNVGEVYRHYDNCLANAHDYNAASSDGISAREQAKRMIDRLKDPLLLIAVNRSMFERILRINIEDICLDAARHDDRALISDLVSLGYINADNIEGIIVAVSRLQDAAISGYLLEVKRREFGKRAFDFDL